MSWWLWSLTAISGCVLRERESSESRLLMPTAVPSPFFCVWMPVRFLKRLSVLVKFPTSFNTFCLSKMSLPSLQSGEGNVKLETLWGLRLKWRSWIGRNWRRGCPGRGRDVCVHTAPLISFFSQIADSIQRALKGFSHSTPSCLVCDSWPCALSCFSLPHSWFCVLSQLTGPWYLDSLAWLYALSFAGSSMSSSLSCSASWRLVWWFSSCFHIQSSWMTMASKWWKSHLMSRGPLSSSPSR